jgi:CRP/FNR family transcriptional regulator
MSNSLTNILSKPLIDELNSVSQLMNIGKGTELLRDGQYVKIVPIVLKGNIKIYIKNEDKELLLYYIKPNESCIMSFSAFIENAPSKVYAITEEETEILAIPVTEIDTILKKYPEFNRLFYSLYNERYIDLIKTINSVLFNKLDSRILSYLNEKSVISNSKQIKVTHKQIALDLGSSREVISRTIKKLEIDGHVILHNSMIEIQ